MIEDIWTNERRVWLVSTESIHTLQFQWNFYYAHAKCRITRTLLSAYGDEKTYFSLDKGRNWSGTCGTDCVAWFMVRTFLNPSAADEVWSLVPILAVEYFCSFSRIVVFICGVLISSLSHILLLNNSYFIYIAKY